MSGVPVVPHGSDVVVSTHEYVAFAGALKPAGTRSMIEAA